MMQGVGNAIKDVYKPVQITPNTCREAAAVLSQIYVGSFHGGIDNVINYIRIHITSAV